MAKCWEANVAQSVEHFHGNKQVYPVLWKELENKGEIGDDRGDGTPSLRKQVIGFVENQVKIHANVAQLVEHIHGYRSYSPLFRKRDSEFRITVNNQQWSRPWRHSRPND